MSLKRAFDEVSTAGNDDEENAATNSVIVSQREHHDDDNNDVVCETPKRQDKNTKCQRITPSTKPSDDDREVEYGKSGAPNDVLKLNVGGRTGIAVFRRTLTHFEYTLLATKFSGRWDETLETDGEGNIFVDQDPELFGQLLSILRAYSNDAPNAPYVEVPVEPPNAFLRMLEYYGLTYHIYPYLINRLMDERSNEPPGFATREISSGCFEIVSKNVLTTVVLCPRHVVGPSLYSFEVHIMDAKELHVGWSGCVKEWKSHDAFVEPSGYCRGEHFYTHDCRDCLMPKPELQGQPNKIRCTFGLTCPDGEPFILWFLNDERRQAYEVMERESLDKHDSYHPAIKVRGKVHVTAWYRCETAWEQ